VTGTKIKFTRLASMSAQNTKFHSSLISLGEDICVQTDGESDRSSQHSSTSCFSVWHDTRYIMTTPV